MNLLMDKIKSKRKEKNFIFWSCELVIEVIFMCVVAMEPCKHHSRASSITRCENQYSGMMIHNAIELILLGCGTVI